MPTKNDSPVVFLEFEQPLESLYEQLEKIKQVGEEGDLNVKPMIKELESKIREKSIEIYGSLTGWQRVQLSRHPERPYTLYYLYEMCDSFVELHGDRRFKDDKAIVGGLAKINGHSFVVIGHQKGINTKMRQYRNFGMANPEGYRKAMRLMRLAEKFGLPVVCMIDTPGAFPGIEAEERGQAEAIARNLYTMAELETPIICYIIGEGASGGAIGIGLGDAVFMFENTWYSVISPESCSSILWRSWDHKERAAEALKLTSDHMFEFGLIDGIISEPLGGAHAKPREMAESFKKHIKQQITKFSKVATDELLDNRIQKYRKMGRFKIAEKAVAQA